MRTDNQKQASRINGKKSNGPVTEEGKLRASRNAIKHGAMAMVHSPDDEPTDLVSKRVDRLNKSLEPRNQFELELVQSLGSNIVRAQRADRAMEKAAQLQAEIGPTVPREIEDELIRLGILTDQMAIMVERAPNIEQMSDTNIINMFSDSAKFLKEMAHGEKSEPLKKAMTKGFLDLGELSNLMKPQDVTIRKDLAAIEYAKPYQDIVDAAKKEIEHLTSDIDAKKKVESALSSVPDEKIVRRYDRYNKAIQGSVLRQLQILKEVREIGKM
jgi:hypothetical protein